MFTIAFVPGVTVTKWARLWEERRGDTPLAFAPVTVADQHTVLHDGRADVSFVRLPVDTTDLSVIRLYSEIAVVVLPIEHALAERDALTLSELDGLTLHDSTAQRDAPATVADAVELVAAGVGAVLLPHAIARQNSRKDVVAIAVTDAEQTEIAIAWREEGTTPDIEEFVGIVRGRSANSSRGAATDADAAPVSKAKAAKARAAVVAAAKKGAPKRAVRAQRRPRQGR